MAKRLFDIVVAGIALLLLAPPMLMIAAWVRLDSPGPALFRQERAGRGGRVFRIHKFRTMVADAPQRGPGLTIGADPRITRAGRWLRATKLDELPQLLDVLAGDMSLVGPRPELPQHLALMPAALRERVLAVRPGITDAVSLQLADESELLAGQADPERHYHEVLLPAKLRAAAEHAERATLWSDLGVLMRTLRLPWRRRP